MFRIRMKSDWLRGGLLALAYFAASQLGLKFALVGHAVTLFWPSSGIALAAILLLGYRFLPAIFIGAFFSDLTTGLPLIAVFGMATGATLESWLGAYLLGRLANFHQRLSEVRDIYRLVLFGGVLSTLSSALIGSAILLAVHAIPLDRYVPTMVFWWMGDALGIVLFAPAVLAFALHKPLPWTRAQISEVMLLLLTLAILLLLVFEYLSGIVNFIHFGMFVLFPVIVWAGMSFNQRFVSSVLMLIFVVAVESTLHGIGPFVGDDLRGVVELWLYIVFLTLLGISVSALNYQRAHAMKALQANQDALNRAQAIGGVGSWQIDLRKNHMEWSDETSRIFGMAGSDHVDYAAYLARIHPDDRGRVDQAWKRALHGTTYDVEHRILVDGKIKWVRERANLDFDENTKRAVFAIGTAHDITARKEEESALRLAARVFESSGEAILITDEKKQDCGRQSCLRADERL